MIIVKGIERDVENLKYIVKYSEVDRTDDSVVDKTWEVPFSGIIGSKLKALSVDYFEFINNYMEKFADFVAEERMALGDDSNAVVQHLKRFDVPVIPEVSTVDVNGEESPRELATVQRILKIEPIDGADKLELATVMGWKAVVEKGKYKEGDLVVYCEVDSFLPVLPEYEFLRKSSYKKLPDGTEGFRIKSVRLRGALSQGLILPITSIPPILGPIAEGMNVTYLLNIKKYDKPSTGALSGESKGSFPSDLVSKTDEIRIQSKMKLLDVLRGKPYYITTKVDGSSGTFYKKDGVLGVCSRNMELKESEHNKFWQIARKYDMVNRIPEGFAVQGEVAGEGIQKNRLQLKGYDFFVFTVKDLKKQQYLSFRELEQFVKDTGLKMVPVEEEGECFNYTLDDLLKKATGSYVNTSNPKEGIVVRPQEDMYSSEIQGRLSFKVLNNDYLLKED